MARSTVAVQFGQSIEERDERRAARDLETLTWTLLGEARNQGVEGMVAVANVVRNRANSGIYPSNPVDVVLQPWQFSTWNSGQYEGNQASTRREVPYGSDLYLTAEEIARRYILTPDTVDLTGGSLFYHTNGLPWRYANSVMGPYGTYQIGDHTFYPRHPVPQVDIGDSDLLAGFRIPPPVPLPRSMRPNGASTQTTREKISELERETQYQRVAAQLDQFRRATPANEGVTGAGAEMGPVMNDDGTIVDRRPTFDASGDGVNDVKFDPSRGAYVTADQFVDGWVGNPQFGPPERALGLGSLIGESFPMVPAANENLAGTVSSQSAPGSVRPEGPASGLPNATDSRIINMVRPEGGDPAGLPVDPEIDHISESGLIARSVRTVAIDPYTGQPILTDAQTTTQGEARKAEELVAARNRIEKAERRMTAEQRYAISDMTEARQLLPLAKPAPLAPDVVAPRPLPAGSRPDSSTAGTVPIPLPRSSGEQARSNNTSVAAPSPAPRPASRTSGTATAPTGGKVTSAQRSAIAAAPIVVKPPVQGLRIPAIRTTATPGIVPNVSTVIVRQSGQEVRVPRAGSVALPPGVKPQVLTPPKPAPVSTATVKPVSTSMVRPAGAPAGMPPAKSAPAAPAKPALTMEQKLAFGGSGAPVPTPLPQTVRPASVTLPALPGTVIEGTLGPATPAAPPAAALEEVLAPPAPSVPAPVAPPRPRAVVPPPRPPPPPSVYGTATGRRYVQGELYVDAMGHYIYQAQPDGKFRKMGSVAGRSAAQAYEEARQRTIDPQTGGQGGNPTFWDSPSGGYQGSGSGGSLL